MCALAEDNLIPGTSFQLEAGSPNSAGRYDGRGVDYGSPAELSQATRLSRPARTSERSTSLRCSFIHAIEGHHQILGGSLVMDHQASSVSHLLHLLTH